MIFFVHFYIGIHILIRHPSHMRYQIFEHFITIITTLFHLQQEHINQSFVQSEPYYNNKVL